MELSISIANSESRSTSRFLHGHRLNASESTRKTHRTLVRSTGKVCRFLPQREQSLSLPDEAIGGKWTWHGQFHAIIVKKAETTKLRSTYLYALPSEDVDAKSLLVGRQLDVLTP